jgi:transcriptional regulator with XRE-family HTH domain
LGERLKDTIKNKDLTQERIAAKIHVPIDTFKNWLTRQTYPNAKQIVDIGHLLDTSAEYLVTGTEHENLATEERRLVSAFRALSKCEQEHIICTIEAWTRKFKAYSQIATLPLACAGNFRFRCYS